MCMTDAPCHRARRRLPPRFEYVSIGNRMIEQLRAVGIDYVDGRYEAQTIRDNDGLEDFDD